MRNSRLLILKINGLLSSELFSSLLSGFLSGSFVCISMLLGFFLCFALKFFLLYDFRITTSAKNLLCISPRVSFCIFLMCYWVIEWRSLSCPCDSWGNPVIPGESGGIQWNYFWKGALPKLPFQGPFILVELSYSRIETGMVPEWTRTESGQMQLNRFIYLFILQLYFLSLFQ